MLKHQAARAIGWSSVDQIVRQGLSFAVSVTMARLLAPEAYGTVVLLNLFTGIAGIFVDVGLTSALIQKKDTTLTDESTVFWFNVVAGCIMGTALFLAAPWIAKFYGIPILSSIARLNALLFVIGAGNAVHNTIFAKRLDFKTPLKVNFVAMLLSAGIGIFFAWKGYGVWALVAQAMSGAVINTAMIWSLSTWRPAFTFSLDSFRSLFRFGGFLFLSYLLETVYQQFYTLIIGKWYGVHDLGIYNRANATKQLPTETLSGVLSRVALPILAQVTDDHERMLRAVRMSIRGIMFINIPMMLGIATVAEPLILTLFGPVWAPAIPLLQILALDGVLYPLHVINLSVLKAMGHSSKFLKVEIVKKIVGITLVILGARYGIHGMAWAVVISSCFCYIFNAYYTGKLLGYGSFQQSRDFLPALSCGILMAVLVIACGHTLTGPPPLRLVVLSLTGVVTFILTAKLCKIAELSDAISFIQKYVKSR